MISKLFAINMKALYAGIFRIGKKKAGSAKKLIVAIVALYLIAAFFVLFATLFHAVLIPFFEAGIGWMYFSLLAMIVFGLSVISTIFTATSQLFGAKDNELLLSMPIKPSAILISRLLVIMSIEYVYAIFVAAPAAILWIDAGYASMAGIALLVAEVLLLPPMALSIALFLAWILSKATTRLKHKNIVSLVISIGFLIGYFYINANIQNYLGRLLSEGEEIADAVRRSIPPFYAFGIGAAQGSLSGFLQFAIWALAPFAAALILLSASGMKMLTSSRGQAKYEYKEKEAKAENALTSLINKELARYWSKPMVILNSSLGSLLMLIGAFMLIARRAQILDAVAEIIPLMGGLPISAIASISLVFACSANNLSASLVSLEGKSLWIMKSCPVSPQKVILSKACTHMIVTSLPCLAASICAGFVAASGLADWLEVILLPQAFIALTALGGISLNLCFPKLDWTNEVQAVKQGLSAMIELFGSMGALALLGLLYAFALKGIMPLEAYLALCAALFAAGAFAVYKWLMKSGAKRIMEI
jgi:ABC-2 type transport system permease protein